jgi:TPR repeat protein
VIDESGQTMKSKLLICFALALTGGLFGPLIVANGQTNTRSSSPKLDIGSIQTMAEIGNARAQSLLGLAYVGGDGVPKDPVQAFYWFKKAADQGDPWGEVGAGMAYINGEGVAKDEREAFKLFKKAAGQGFFPAQDQLGVLYVDGIGCEKDLAEAYKWFTLSARQGYPTAAQHQTALAQIAKPDQIDEGYRRAEAFVPISQDQTNLLVASGPSSSPAQVATKPRTMAEVQAEVKTGYENFIPAVTNRMGTNFGPVAAKVLASVETNVLTALTNSALPEIGSAAKYLKELKEENRLPGFPKDRHGNVSIDLPLAGLQAATYPFSVMFKVVLVGDSLTNHYTVTRPSADTGWQLEKAWRSDTEGHTIVEWPVK